MKRTLGLWTLGVSVLVISQACGSSDAKKKVGPQYSSGGGDGGAPSSQGASKATGGDDASAGDVSADGGATGGNAGATGNTNAGQTSSAAGAAGTTGSGDECEAGKAECDGDPLTVCEQALNLVTSCGDCNTTCKSTNASVVCDPVELECKITDCTSGFGSCDDNPANGCETNLVSNAKHCGACGRDCTALNTTCAVDHCDKTPLQQNLPALGAKTWAFGPSGMYHATGYNYAVRHMPLDGAAPAVVWAPVNKTVGTESLLITPTDVIWAERGSAAFTSPVLKKAVGAGASALPDILFTPEYQPTFLKIQGNAFYWMSGDYQSGDPSGFVYSRSRTAAADEPGTRIVNVDQGTHGAVLEFAPTSNALYWVTSSALNGAANELRTTPLAGGTPVAVPPVPGGGSVTAINSGYGVPIFQTAGDTLYFNRNVDDSFLNGIYRFKAGDAAPTQIVSAENVNTMVIDETSVYYGSQNVTGIFKAPLTGGAGVAITDGNWSRIVGQEGKFLYAFGYGVSTLYKIVK